MKNITLLTLASGWLALQSAQAFNPQPDPPRYGMIGITPGETLRLNAANPLLPSVGQIPPPCRVELTFVDAAGRQLLPPVQFTLRPGQSTHYDLNGDQLFPPILNPPAAQRAEVRPVLHVLPNPTAIGITLLPPGPCVSSIEMLDNATGKTLVTSGPQNPGVIAGFNPQPDPPGKVFGQLGLVADQTIRLNAANVGEPTTGLFPPGPCRVTLALFGPEGGILAQSSEVLQPGETTFLDYQLPAGGVNPLRIEIRAEVGVERASLGSVPPGPCRATLEVFDNPTGRTTAIQSPQVPQ